MVSVCVCSVCTWTTVLVCLVLLDQLTCDWLLLGQLYGLEKFWAFLKYTRKPNIVVDAKLSGYLSKFKRLEDFRIQEVSILFKMANNLTKLYLI